MLRAAIFIRRFTMKIQIYGSGCKKCAKLAENAKAAAEELGVECEIEKVQQLDDISAAGVLFTPALGIDGEVKSSGKVLSPDAIKKILEK